MNYTRHLKRELAAAKAEVKTEMDFMLTLNDTQILAVQLHDQFCTSNHYTDQCGWYYERGPELWNKSSPSHYIWYLKALNARLALKDDAPNTLNPNHTILKIANALNPKPCYIENRECP